MPDYTVRILKPEEKILTRPLYEEAFPEDTPPLVDFYYRRRMSVNTAYAALGAGEAADGGALAPHVYGMSCLNPYPLRYGGTDYVISYISAVATEKKHRREGIMRACLTAQLIDENRRGAPFVILEPANPAYYWPFGFAYAGDTPHLRLKSGARVRRVRLLTDPAVRPDEAEQALRQKAAAFLNRYLSARYVVFFTRDASYLENLLAEIDAGNGTAEVLFEDAAGRGAETLSDGTDDPKDRERFPGVSGASCAASPLIGVCFRDFPDTPDEDSRFYIEEKYAESTAPDSAFAMIRITNLPAFVRPARLAPGIAGPRVHWFRFEDPLIPGNDGLWKWTLTETGSEIEKMPETTDPESAAGSAGIAGAADAGSAADHAGVPAFTAPEFTQWLLAYAPCRKDVPWKDEVLPVGRAYFDEET